MFVEQIVGAFTGQNRRDKHRAVCTAVVVTATVAGAAGVVAGLLTAPKAGAETRQDVAEFARSGVDTVKQASGEVVHKVKDTADRAVREARKQGRKMRRGARNVGEELDEAAQDVAYEAEDVVDEVIEGAEDVAKTAREGF